MMHTPPLPTVNIQPPCNGTTPISSVQLAMQILAGYALYCERSTETLNAPVPRDLLTISLEILEFSSHK